MYVGWYVVGAYVGRAEYDGAYVGSYVGEYDGAVHLVKRGGPLQAGINGQEAAAPTRWDEYSRRGKFVANVGAGAASPMLFVRRPNAANGSKVDADKVADPATQNLIACCYRGLTAANAGSTCEGNTATWGGCANWGASSPP